MARHHVQLIRSFVVEADERIEVENIVQKHIRMETVNGNGNYQVRAVVTELKEGEIGKSNIQALCDKLIMYNKVISEDDVSNRRKVYHESIQETLQGINDHFEKLMNIEA
jgi:hypothetical protein